MLADYKKFHSVQRAKCEQSALKIWCNYCTSLLFAVESSKSPIQDSRIPWHSPQSTIRNDDEGTAFIECEARCRIFQGL